MQVPLQVTGLMLSSSSFENSKAGGDTAAAAAAAKRARKTLAREGELLGLNLISQDLRSAHEGMLMSWDCLDF